MSLFKKLPKDLLNKLPNELWIMIDKYSVNHYLNEKLKEIRPMMYSYKITDIDLDMPCQRYIYKNGAFEWKINEYNCDFTLDEDKFPITHGVILFKKKVINKFDTFTYDEKVELID